jgi:hypothetical protein
VSRYKVSDLMAAARIYIDTPHSAPEDLRRSAADTLGDFWQKSPALVRIGAVIRIMRWYW